MSPRITQDVVLEALSHVLDPELGKDLVTLGMIDDVKVDGSEVSFTINLTTPACPLREQIQENAKKAVLAVDGVSTVNIEMGAEVPSGQKKAEHISIKNSVAIASGKGGVGKSTVAVNVAVALAQSGAKVGLLDADIYGPNIPTMMGVEQVGGATEDQKIIPAEAHGVKVMSIGFLVKPEQAIIWRGPLLHSAIKQFINDVEWGELDYLIIDLPPGTGDVQLSLNQVLDLQGGVIVTLPQDVSIDDARRGLNMFQKLEIPVFGVVENMSYLELPGGENMDIFGSGGGQALADEAGIPFIGGVPIDPAVRVGGDSGLPILVSQPDAPVSQAFRTIASAIAAQISVEAYRG
ncbi:MAG: Iron-sulfur cluster carrier protein [Chloroflexi bacterium]|nr:Iron-sulfur cluster carrier protein [Chloroflexota bacterium]